jgi:hypothetical protein
MPSPYKTVVDANGAPIAGALVWTYLAGTSTPQPTYTDATLQTANTNPIVADSAGRFVAFLAPGSSYKYVFETAAVPPVHGSLIRTVDLVSAIPSSAGNVDITGLAGEALAFGNAVYLSDGSDSRPAGRWYRADCTNAALSATPSTVGIALAPIAQGFTGTVRTAGTVTGVSVVAGAPYWVGTPPGTLTATKPAPPNFVRQLGVADSTTSLILSGLTAAPQVSTVITDATTGTGIWTLAITGSVVVDWIGTADTVFDGLNVPNLASFGFGTTVRIVNTTAKVLSFRHQVAGAGSAAFYNMATSGPTPIGPTGAVTYLYDPVITQWRLIQHEPGGWIPVPYNAANFGSNAGSWTVPSGSVSTYAYSLDGRTLSVSWFLNPTTIAGSPTILTLTLPNGYVPAADAIVLGWYGATLVTQAQSNNPKLSLFHVDSSAWVAGASVLIAGMARCPIN